MEKKELDGIKFLRSKTGLSIKQCYEALIKSKFILDDALKILYQINLVKQETINDSDNTVGSIWYEAAADNKSFAIVQCNCKTDFAAKSFLFQKFLIKISKAILFFKLKCLSEISLCSNEILKNIFFDDRFYLERQLNEPVIIKKVFFFETNEGILNYYKHIANSNNMLVSIVCIDKKDLIMAENLSIHIASLNVKENFIFEDFSKSDKINFFLDFPYLFDQKITLGEYLKKNNIKILSLFLFNSVIDM